MTGTRNADFRRSISAGRACGWHTAPLFVATATEPTVRIPAMVPRTTGTPRTSWMTPIASSSYRGGLESPLEMTDRGLRDVRCNDQPFVVRRAENPHVGVPRDLQAPKQTGPSILRERNDGGAVFELDRLDADAPGRGVAALLPQV